MQRGLKAVILLATEAAEKLDKYAEVEQQGKITELKEYQDLMKFYQSKVFHRFQAPLEGTEHWPEQWGSLAVENAQKGSLKGLESVRSDREYELFYIKKEDGTPYFNRSLLRHLQLVGKFDTLLIDPKSDDLFVRLKIMQDRDSHHAAPKNLKCRMGSNRRVF